MLIDNTVFLPVLDRDPVVYYRSRSYTAGHSHGFGLESEILYLNFYFLIEKRIITLNQVSK